MKNVNVFMAAVTSILLSMSCGAQDSVASVSDAAELANEWITLGTDAGPILNPTHSQPANALLVGGNTYIVDAGDGAVSRLSAAGGSMRDIDAVFLSHLHFDHTAGLVGIIALRWQTNAPNMLTIYGPPGTRQSVNGIFDFMQYSTEGHLGLPGEESDPPNRNVRVVEIRDGSVVELDDFRLTAVRNTHFSWPANSEEFEKFQSLSFKFELADRTIVYTGDTGPSAAVVELANDADLLISEMTDAEFVVERIQRMNPHMPAIAAQNIRTHIEEHHMSAEQVADLATSAGVSKLVITHMSPQYDDPEQRAVYSDRIAVGFNGDIVMANDLDRF